MSAICYNSDWSQGDWDTFLGDLDPHPFAGFIDNELRELEIYDSNRPVGHVYSFPPHVRRVSGLLTDLAQAIGFSDTAAETMGRLSLVHDCGKRFQSVSIWDTSTKPDKVLKDIRRAHTVIGANHILHSLNPEQPAVKVMEMLARFHHESANGHGYLGMAHATLSLPVKMLIICDSFDGLRIWRPSYDTGRDLSPQGVLNRMSHEKSEDFDPTLLAAFAQMVQNKLAKYQL